VVATLALALRAGGGAERGPRRETRPVRELLRSRSWGAVLVALYGGLSATLLLHAQVPYLRLSLTGDPADHPGTPRPLAILLTMLPLVAAMGFVEWRAHRFGQQARLLLRRVRRPADFVPRVWLLLFGNVAACALAVAVPAVVLLLFLRHARLLSGAVLAMAAAYPVLAGAYLISFILAGQNRYGRMCLALAAAVGAHLGLAAVRPHPDALADTTAFAASAVLLLALLVAAVGPALGQAWRYR
jgi:hypothetical protein